MDAYGLHDDLHCTGFMRIYWSLTYRCIMITFSCSSSFSFCLFSFCSFSADNASTYGILIRILGSWCDLNKIALVNSMCVTPVAIVFNLSHSSHRSHIARDKLCSTTTWWSDSLARMKLADHRLSRAIRYPSLALHPTSFLLHASQSHPSTVDR